MKRFMMTGAAALLAMTVGTTASAQPRDVEPLVYFSSFEAPAYLAGPLVGQDEWAVSPVGIDKNAAMVQEGTVSLGKQSVRITPAVLGGADTEWIRPIGYATTLDRPIIDIRWDLFLDRGKLNSMSWEFVTYDKQHRPLSSVFIAGDMGDTVGYWAGGPTAIMTGISINRRQWNTFEVRLDFVGGTAQFLLNDVELNPITLRHVNNPNLVPEGAIGSVAMRVLGPGDDLAFLDNISIRPNQVVCPANCDGSWSRPLLNANDFLCFMNSFAEASMLTYKEQLSSYANFDRSVTDPVLNANDFVAFMNSYAQGCP